MVLSRLVLPAAALEPLSLRRRAAVAIVVGPDDDTLFIRRATREGDPWSGDMAFPGGRHDPGDLSLRHTAEREAREEVGLDLSGAPYLGAMDCLMSPLRDPSGAFGIFPFVYRVDAFPPLDPNEEVASVHYLNLGRIFAGEGRGEFRYQGWGVDRMLPCVRIDGIFLWGLTLRMIDNLAERAGVTR